MELIEAPSIQCADRRLIFPSIKWLTKSKFEEYLNNRYQIHPYLHQSIDEDDSNPNSRIYIGKTIPSNLDEGIQYSYYYEQRRQINLEVIGTVFKDLNNEWQLSVSHGSSVTQVKKDFLVLCIDDVNSYEWTETNLNQIPKYALRGAIDQFSKEYFYIGTNCLVGEINGEYHTESGRNSIEKVPPLFGKVHPSHMCLYVPFNDLEVFFPKYYTLTLKPSPASLKILCRLKLRSLLSNSNEKIEKININETGIKYLPKALIDFIKWPTYLSVGEFMLKGERIVREDEKYEILIEDNGNLVCQTVINEANKNEINDTKLKRIIRNGVHSIWLHRFMVIAYSNYGIQILHQFDKETPDYKFKINYSETPNFMIEC